MKRLGVLLVLALAATLRAGDEDVVAKARAEFNAIAREAEWSTSLGRRAPHGPSLTKLVRDFVSRDANVVRRVEAAAWADAKQGRKFDPRQLAVEQTIRFLHGVPARGDRGPLKKVREQSGFDVVAGAILLRHGYGSSYDGTGFEVFGGSYDDLVGKQPPRSAPSPTAADLLAIDVDERNPPQEPYWSDSALIDFGMALGETCATDDAAFTKLLARAIDHPRSRHLLLAVGWSGRPKAVEFLSQSIRDLVAAGIERGRPWQPRAIDSAVAALRHADESAWKRVVASLSDEQCFRIVGAPTAPEILRSRLAAIDLAKDVDARRAATLRLCTTTASLNDLPGGDDAVRVLRALVACADGKDDALRKAALDATERLFCGRPGRRDTFNGDFVDGTRIDEGTVLGLIAGPDAVLHRAAEDAAAGRIVFRESILPYSEQAKTLSKSLPAFSFVPQDLLSDDSGPVSVIVSAAWTKDGLHLRLVNESDQDVSVNPIALRYGIAENVVVTTTPAGGAARSETRFRIKLGSVAVCCCVPANVLVRLHAGRTYECDVTVLPELRGGPPLDLSVDVGFVAMGAMAPPVVCFDWTRVL